MLLQNVSQASPDVSPLRSVGSIPGCVLATSSPIQAATANIVQQPIISMEDDEISDQEVVSHTWEFKVFLLFCSKIAQ